MIGCGTRPPPYNPLAYAVPMANDVTVTDAGGPVTVEKDVTPSFDPEDAGASEDGGASSDAPAGDGAGDDAGGGNQPSDSAQSDASSSDGAAQDSTSGGGGADGSGPAGGDTSGGNSGGADTGGAQGGVDAAVLDSKPGPIAQDKDGDGYFPGSGVSADCDDGDPNVHPGMQEVCNGKDDDCTFIIDDIDNDGDGFSVCKDDCDDTDININPLAGRDCKNGKDNDCSGVIDAVEDGDGDGFKGCADCDDYDKNVYPGSFEKPVDLVDNDCDGKTDEAPDLCDDPAKPLNTGTLSDYPKAIELCKGMGTDVISSKFTTLANNNAKAIKKVYGPPNVPQAGGHMVVLSSGNAAAKGQTGYKLPQPGTAFTNTKAYPNVKCKNSGTVYDFTEWTLQLKVPPTAQSFSFDFNFMSAEYPEYVGTQFNDKFLVILNSQKFKGNVSFDSKGNCISINNAFFTVCNGCSKGAAGLSGTGYENGIGGGTGWLTTTSPVTPGETITVRFIIFDEGDHIYDSAVLIDNFRWDIAAPKNGGPSTIRPGA